MMTASPWAGLMPTSRPRRTAAPGRVHRTADDRVTITNPASKAGRVLTLLRDNGPMKAELILLDDELEIPSASYLFGCMKHHIHCGRVLVKDGVYSLNQDYDEALQAEISAAVKLLKERGYSVEKKA